MVSGRVARSSYNRQTQCCGWFGDCWAKDQTPGGQDPGAAGQTTCISREPVAQQRLARITGRPRCGACWLGHRCCRRRPIWCWRSRPPGCSSGSMMRRPSRCASDRRQPAPALAMSAGRPAAPVTVQGDAGAGELNWLIENLRWDIGGRPGARGRAAVAGAADRALCAAAGRALIGAARRWRRAPGGLARKRHHDAQFFRLAPGHHRLHRPALRPGRGDGTLSAFRQRWVRGPRPPAHGRTAPGRSASGGQRLRQGFWSTWAPSSSSSAGAVDAGATCCRWTWPTSWPGLQDRVPPIPGGGPHAWWRKAFRPPSAELFRHLRRQPVASASIAQVHFATLQDGRGSPSRCCAPACWTSSTTTWR